MIGMTSRLRPNIHLSYIVYRLLLNTQNQPDTTRTRLTSMLSINQLDTYTLFRQGNMSHSHSRCTRCYLRTFHQDRLCILSVHDKRARRDMVNMTNYRRVKTVQLSKQMLDQRSTTIRQDMGNIRSCLHRVHNNRRHRRILCSIQHTDNIYPFHIWCTGCQRRMIRVDRGPYFHLYRTTSQACKSSQWYHQERICYSRL